VGVFENGVLRKYLSLCKNRNQTKSEFRILDKEELSESYGSPTPLSSVKRNLRIRTRSCYMESRYVYRLLWGGSVNCTWGMEKSGRMDLEGSRSWRRLEYGTGKGWCSMTDFYDGDDDDDYDNDDDDNNNNSSSLCTILVRAFKNIAWLIKWPGIFKF